VVWPELWLTRGDPRLGKRLFTVSIALSTYTGHITRRPPRLCNTRVVVAVALLVQLYTPSCTQAPCRQTFHHRQPAQQPISSYQSHHEPAPDSSSLLSLGGQQSTLTIGSPPYLSIRSPYCRSVPQRAGILQTATIIIAALLFHPSQPSSKVHSRPPRSRGSPN
jgi:hypothetical protein